MRHFAVLLCLLAALTGTPLRQSEAAADFSRSYAELSELANIEPPDGGVGDDSGVGTFAPAHDCLTGDVLSPITPFFLPPPITPDFTPRGADGLRQHVWCPQGPPNLRHAWLQTFLF